MHAPTQPVSDTQHSYASFTSKQVSSFVSISVPSTMPPASSAEVPLAYTAGTLLTGIHRDSPVHFSIADNILLLHEFVGHK